jgi:hypothetical protein
MVEVPGWGEGYPSPDVLRAECDALRESIVEAVLAGLPEGSVLGVYAGGSSLKPWDSVIDYVPELSDVDVHVLLTDPDLLERDLGRSFALQADYEARFAARVPAPLHYPRPQIMVINRHLANPAFLAGPPGTSRTLHGKEHDEVRPQPSDPEFVRAVDRESLLNPREQEWIGRLADHVFDRPAKYLWQPVRDASWRVAPTGPRVLSILGASFAEAWGHNRTGVCERLLAAGQHDLAASYAGYYLEGWRFFLSGYRDSDAARQALLHARRVLELGAAVARAA